jgi:hypothetical protein
MMDGGGERWLWVSCVLSTLGSACCSERLFEQRTDCIRQSVIAICHGHESNPLTHPW